MSLNNNKTTVIFVFNENLNPYTHHKHSPQNKSTKEKTLLTSFLRPEWKNQHSAAKFRELVWRPGWHARSRAETVWISHGRISVDTSYQNSFSQTGKLWCLHAYTGRYVKSELFSLHWNTRSANTNVRHWSWYFSYRSVIKQTRYWSSVYQSHH